MMARDPLLAAAAEREIRDGGRTAAAALLTAAEAQAQLLAGVDDPMLAARADDVRSVGRRAARIAADSGERDDLPSGTPLVLVARDLGPADVAELDDDVVAIALAAGAVSAHAAIVARARGLAMVVAAGDGLFDAQPASLLVVDGDSGDIVLEPGTERVLSARAAARERERMRGRALAARDVPAVTRDGHRVRVLANVASAAEARTALDAGAEGAGLIRTELPFLDARDWPTEEDHLRQLLPLLATLQGRTATVRVLDFGGDKTPPFLRGTGERGLRLLLGAGEALESQLRAILRAAGSCELRVLLPMVDSHEELIAARRAIAHAVADVPGALSPDVGAMIETPRAAAAAFQLAADADFLSIGTNDLTHAVLGSDRFTAAEAVTHHPSVLRAIHRSVRAAHSERLPIEVCGEAASDARTLALLVGLGVDEVSVGAARVGPTREWVRALDQRDSRSAARSAVAAQTAGEVAALTAPLERALLGTDRVSLAAG
jgi:phosphoenolpyruvate-protein kinase (PTS system EI component)